jgi:hypothetical protein
MSRNTDPTPDYKHNLESTEHDLELIKYESVDDESTEYEATVDRPAALRVHNTKPTEHH